MKHLLSRLAVRILAGLGLSLFLCWWVRAEAPRPAVPATPAMPRCRCVLERGPGLGDVRLEWTPRRFDPEEIDRIRADAEHRRVYNELLPTAIDARLEVATKLRVGDVLLEPGTYRIAPHVDAGGALALTILVDQDRRNLNLLVDEDRRQFSHLCLALTPSEVAGFELHLQWGGEYGKLEFFD